MGISLGLWRSMSIIILNVPFAIEKRISFSALSSKMSRRFVWQKAMRNKQDLPTYNAPIYLRTECSELKRDGAQTRKKSASSNLVHNLRSEFDPHRHWRRKASVRQYNGAAMISTWFNLWAEQVFIFITREYIDAPKFCAFAWFQSNRLFILLLQAEKEIRHFTQKLHVQIIIKPRSPRSETII